MWCVRCKVRQDKLNYTISNHFSYCSLFFSDLKFGVIWPCTVNQATTIENSIVLNVIKAFTPSKILVGTWSVIKEHCQSRSYAICVAKVFKWNLVLRFAYFWHKCCEWLKICLITLQLFHTHRRIYAFIRVKNHINVIIAGRIFGQVHPFTFIWKECTVRYRSFLF